MPQELRDHAHVVCTDVAVVEGCARRPVSSGGLAGLHESFGLGRGELLVVGEVVARLTLRRALALRRGSSDPSRFEGGGPARLYRPQLPERRFQRGQLLRQLHVIECVDVDRGHALDAADQVAAERNSRRGVLRRGILWRWRGFRGELRWCVGAGLRGELRWCVGAGLPVIA